jgi:integrase
MQVTQPIRDKELIEQIQFMLKSQSMRDFLIFSIGIHCGLHLNDLLLLKVKDIRGKSQVTIREKRTGKDKTFSISHQLMEWIKVYAENKYDDDYLFPSQRTGLPIKRSRVYRILNDVGKQLGIQDMGTHTLRKTFGYHYYLKTKNISVLRDLFNHSAPCVTIKYIGLDHEQVKQLK